MKDEKGRDMAEETRHKLRFFLLIELMDFQRTTFQYNLKKEDKQRFNNLYGHLKTFRNRLLEGMTEQGKEYIDDMAALMWESLDELEQAQDPRNMLLLMKAFNAGLVKMEGMDKPLKEVSFEELNRKEVAA
jgi:hypothetical protein